MLCRGPMGLTDLACGRPFIRPMAATHSMAGPFMGLVAEGFRGVEAVVGSSAAAGDSVVGGGEDQRVPWGPSVGSVGIGCPIPRGPAIKKRRCYYAIR